MCELATKFLFLVAKWRLSFFLNFEPCVGKYNVMIIRQHTNHSLPRLSHSWSSARPNLHQSALISSKRAISRFLLYAMKAVNDEVNMNQFKVDANARLA